MCKVMAVAGIKPENVGKLWDFMVAVTPHMATMTDPHGVGYAAQHPGGVFGERWLNPKEAWNLRQPFTKNETKVLNEFKGALECQQRYNSFGDFTNDTFGLCHAAILHSRYATCGINIENTHPFVSADGNTALIHNGVINNTRELKNYTSTCDSECILNEYDKLDVQNAPEGIDLVAKKLSGYWACAVLTQDNNGNQYLDIFKDNAANLTATYIPQLDAMVFCTKPEIIKETCKDLKWKYRTFFNVKAGQMIRINAVTGAVVGIYKFDPVGKPRSWESSWSNSGYGSGFSNGYVRQSDGTWRQESTPPALPGSVKSAQESAKTFLDGARGVMASMGVVEKLADEVSEKEMKDFNEEVTKRVESAIKDDVDAENPNSPFHVKSNG